MSDDYQRIEVITGTPCRRRWTTGQKLRRAKTLIAQGLRVPEAAARIKVGKTALYAALGEKAVNASDRSARKVPLRPRNPTI